MLTGGGSGGHVIPTLSIFFTLKNVNELKKHYKSQFFFFFGRKKGIEREVFAKLVDKYFSVITSKLRTHFSLLNFFDMAILPFSFFDAIYKLWRIKSKIKNADFILFSSGGYVSLPVSIACFVFRVPIVIHEQTSRAGLANRIVSKFAKKVLISFESSKIFFNHSKIIYTGYPLSKKVRLQLASNQQNNKQEKMKLSDIARAFSINIPKDKKLFFGYGGQYGLCFSQ